MLFVKRYDRYAQDLIEMAKEASQNFLEGLKFFFVQKKLSKVQHAIVREKILKFGGAVLDTFSSTMVTHVIFPRNVTLQDGLQSMRLLELPSQIVSISMDWITSCIANRKVLPTASYEVSL